MAFVVVMLVFLVAGIAEVGWAFMQTSVIAHAARDGARFGATLGGAAERDTNGCFTGTATTQIEDHVKDILATIGFTDADVAVDQDCDGTVPIVSVTVSGTIAMLMNLPMLPSSLNIDRVITFADEGRLACGC
jgi:Flp pilus assembly protein TadG